MPYFMDVHHNMQNVSLAEIEAGHLRDVEAQGRHGVNYVRFFADHDGGSVYCVAEAPSAEACIAVHVEANGARPDEIIPIEPNELERFVGSQPTSPIGNVLRTDGQADPGVRTIMFTDIVDSTRLTDELGDRAGIQLVKIHDSVVGDRLHDASGRIVKHTGDGLMASFDSCDDAITCAIGIQGDLGDYRTGPHALPLRIRVGLHLGEPVAAHGDLFGIAVNVSRRICDAAAADEILASQAVSEATSLEVDFEPLGPQTFKGVRTPVEVSRVCWT